MNALARDISAAANISTAMARDLLGFGTLRPSAITYHTILSSLDTGAGLSLAETLDLIRTERVGVRHVEV